MGYEVLIDTLLKEGKNKSREIMEKGRVESEAILREAKGKIVRLEQESRHGLEKELQAGRARILNQARIEHRWILLQAKHEVLDKLFERVQERLQLYLKQAETGDLSCHWVTRFVEEALGEEKGTDLKAIIDEGAPDLLERILRQKGVVCQRAKEPQLGFGFRLIWPDGRLEVTNSYAARLEKVKPALLLELHNLLFRDPP